MDIALSEFDRVFDSLVDEPLAGRSAPSARRGNASLGNNEYRVRQAIAFFYRGDYRRCLHLLRELGEEVQTDPLVAAFTGASRALALGEVRNGLNACVTAVRRGFFLPDVYCALGVVLLRTGDRSKAFAAFNRGLAVDPAHAELRTRTRAMGVRRPPVIPLLGRRHPLNRVLGRIRYRLSSA